MALDFQQVRNQVQQLGAQAPARARRLNALREQARELLAQHAGEIIPLRQKVQAVVRSHDPSLRCALPVAEALEARTPLPPLAPDLTVIAADGSQIYYDRHAAAEYFLVNVGVIKARYGERSAPQIQINSDLYFGDELYDQGEYPSEEKISLLRDLREREILAEQAALTPGMVVTLTDGPLEIWGLRAREGGAPSSAGQSRRAYLEALTALGSAQAAIAGYVDKPGEDYVVRLLEIAAQPPEKARERPLFGVRDVDLYAPLLAPGERSAVFEIQSRSAQIYRRHDPGLALHFFYLNVGAPGRPWLARVETLAWTLQNQAQMEALHAVLVDQCRKLGARRYPYLLHRAHETALVSYDEKRQLEVMIQNELRRHGLHSVPSVKQSLKDLPRKGRYAR